MSRRSPARAAGSAPAADGPWWHGLEPVHPSWSLDGSRPARVLTGLQLRVALAVLALGLLLAVTAAAGPDRLRLVTGAVAIAVVVGMAAAPASPLPTLYVLVIVLVVLDGPLPVWAVLPVGSALHAVHIGASWCAVVPARAQVEGAVLLPSARRWLLTQVLMLPVAAVLPATGQLRGPADDPALRVLFSTLAGGVLAGLGLVLVVLSVAVVRGRTATGRTDN